MSSSLMEELRFSPHMHAVFHGHVTKDMVTWPLVAKRIDSTRTEIRDAAEGNPYFLATLYYGREATQKQINDAVENLKALLTLRYS